MLCTEVSVGTKQSANSFVGVAAPGIVLWYAPTKTQQKHKQSNICF